MSENTNDHKEDPSNADAEETVWPPAIERPAAGHSRPVALTKAQRDRVRYRWFHVFAALMTVAMGTAMFSSPAGVWHIWHVPHEKLLLLCLLLLGFAGNVWRAYQGWHPNATLDLKAILHRQRQG